jgi:hypothetical protein
MRRSTVRISAAAFAFALLALSASNLRVASAAPRWGLTGFLGFQGYTMEDANSAGR